MLCFNKWGKCVVITHMCALHSLFLFWPLCRCRGGRGWTRTKLGLCNLWFSPKLKTFFYPAVVAWLIEQALPIQWNLAFCQRWIKSRLGLFSLNKKERETLRSWVEIIRSKETGDINIIIIKIIFRWCLNRYYYYSMILIRCYYKSSKKNTREIPAWMCSKVGVNWLVSIK